uniref:BTB domain-containing protein n=1 Tax=Strongyloides papillosus TaxID=174720 RepID=A0A0N5BQ02_STREA
MYERGDLSDYKIICEDREFLVHKFILASQSPVFMDIFKSSSGKKEIEDVIKIVDSKQEFVEKMIEYIYCGNLGKDLSVDESIGLLHLAHKYDIESLKLLCERELVDKLNNENVHMLAEISEKYQALNLKKVLFEEYVFNILIICYMSNFFTDLRIFFSQNKVSLTPKIKETFDFISRIPKYCYFGFTFACLGSEC